MKQKHSKGKLTQFNQKMVSGEKNMKPLYPQIKGVLPSLACSRLPCCSVLGTHLSASLQNSHKIKWWYSPKYSVPHRYLIDICFNFTRSSTWIRKECDIGSGINRNIRSSWSTVLQKCLKRREYFRFSDNEQFLKWNIVDPFVFIVIFCNHSWKPGVNGKFHGYSKETWWNCNFIDFHFIVRIKCKMLPE